MTVCNFKRTAGGLFKCQRCLTVCETQIESRRCKRRGTVVSKPTETEKVKRGYKRCPRCTRELKANYENFYSNKRQLDGLSCHCKICQNQMKREANKPEDEPRLPVPLEAQICGQCKTLKELTDDHFYRNVSTITGWSYHCKKCHNNITKQRQKAITALNRLVELGDLRVFNSADKVWVEFESLGGSKFSVTANTPTQALLRMAEEIKINAC